MVPVTQENANNAQSPPTVVTVSGSSDDNTSTVSSTQSSMVTVADVLHVSEQSTQQINSDNRYVLSNAFY